MEKPKISIESLEPMFNKIGELTKIQRYLIYFGTIVLILGAFIWLSYIPKNKQISKLKQEQEKVDKELVVAKKNAAELPAYEKKMEEAKIQFEVVKNTLPEKNEIPSLLTGISQAGRDAGLEFEKFQPNNEIKKDFYAEIPVSISLTGSYHSITVFFDKVARLSRIVNMTNVVINSSGADSEKLKASCQAVTYRFLETS